MIREGKKLPADILVKIPAAVAKIAEDKSVIALYTFGSLAESNLRPLSDVDFAVLLSESLDRQERFSKSIDLIGILNQTLKTDEVDLLILNDDPLRFAYNVLKKGKLVYCKDRNQLLDFIEKTIKLYLDFKPVRDRFDEVFLEGVGYHGRAD